ncbi:MAG: Cysteine desulfuration protein SufE [Cryomorphaceae bacterium]|nr:SufE family protein [Cryomorphaceae bacterium]CAI8161469.1 MAG: Cysteine desulfuration protein SufE [Cryomorphaceae bacterium]
MATIKERQEVLVEEFEFFDEWMDKYNHIIEMGKSLDALPEEKKNDDLLVQGCQSKVWLHAEKSGDNVLFQADADAIIAKGIVAMLIDVFDNQPAKEVAVADLGFLEEIGLKDHLSPTRANGLMSMIKQMKFYALAFAG